MTDRSASYYCSYTPCSQNRQKPFCEVCGNSSLHFIDGKSLCDDCHIQRNLEILEKKNKYKQILDDHIDFIKSTEHKTFVSVNYAINKYRNKEPFPLKISDNWIKNKGLAKYHDLFMITKNGGWCSKEKVDAAHFRLLFG